VVTSAATERYMITAKRDQVLQSLRDHEYRRALADDIGTGIAFQIRLLREDRGWTQGELAERTGKRQEAISQWENPNYGRYTLSTLKDLAGAFDVALLVRFAPFSEIIDWTVNLSAQRLTPPSFDAEFAADTVSAAPPRRGTASDSDDSISALMEQMKQSVAAARAAAEEEFKAGENQYAKAA